MKVERSNNGIGLDIGTSRIVAARQPAAEIEYNIQLNAFVTIPYSKMTENVLRKEEIAHSVEGGEIVVYGNESEQFAGLLNSETRRTMTRGFLNPAEPYSLKLIRELALSVAGKPEKGT